MATLVDDSLAGVNETYQNRPVGATIRRGTQDCGLRAWEPQQTRFRFMTLAVAGSLPERRGAVRRPPVLALMR